MPSDTSDEGAVYITAVGNITDAYLLKGRLEAEGISPVLVKGEGEGPYPAGAAYLWVPEHLEAKARALLRAIEEGAIEQNLPREGGAEEPDER